MCENVNKLKPINQSDRPIVTDGAMGTLRMIGVKIDACFDALNLTQPAARGGHPS